MYAWFHHEIHDCRSGFDRRNTENIKLSLSEILPVNLVDCICQLQLPATNTAYLVGFRGHRKLITICGKRWAAEFGKLARGIWKTFAAENCGPYLSLLVSCNCYWCTYVCMWYWCWSVESALTGCASAIACFSYNKVDKTSSDSADASDDARCASGDARWAQC